MKEYLAIHDFKHDYFNLNLSNYILTFDDALFSQYYYWPVIQEIQTEKILSVCTSFIDIKDTKREQFNILKPNFVEFPDAFKCLELFRNNNNKENYMNLSEILNIEKDVIVAAHSHRHYKSYSKSLKQKLEEVKKDTEQMLEWFYKYLRLRPNIYTYPHYEEDIILKTVLKTYGFTKFIGKRKQIEDEKY